MRKKFKLTSFSLFASLIAALGGLLFGYTTSVIAGALLFIARDFELSRVQQEVVVSTLLIGALIGAVLSGFSADRYGRKKTLFITVALFFLGTFILTGAANFDALLVGRFITGLGVGLASVTVPLYIAEMAPSEKRGAYVSLNQLMITVGVLISFIVSYLYSGLKEWREMFSFAFVPLAIQFIGLFFIPETPSWLISRNQTEAAEKVLHKLKIASPNQHLAHLEKTQDVPDGKSWKALFKPELRIVFAVGIGLSFFQQITGINAVVYYAPRIFQLAGYKSPQMATFVTMLLGIVNVSMTVVALKLIDWIGRRTLLITGLIGMAISLAVMGFAFFDPEQEGGFLAVFSLFAYVSFFAISLGPVVWLMISEIFPLGIRGRAMGAATFVNWSSNYIVSLTFLSLVHWAGAAITFWLFMLICLIGLWFVWKIVPETKGKTFEEIQKSWKKS